MEQKPQKPAVPLVFQGVARPAATAPQGIAPVELSVVGDGVMLVG
jgi:hypothetical protein